MRPPRLLVAAGLAVALVAAALAAVPATASSPPLPILTVGSTSAAANPGDSVGAPLTSPSLQLTTSPTNNIGLSCTQSFWSGQVINDPVGPGPASIRFGNPFQFQGCTDNIQPGITVNGGTMSGAPAPLLISSATTGYPIQLMPFNAPFQIVISMNTMSGPVNCVYRTSSVLNGTTTPGTNPWMFNAQPFGLVTGTPAICGPAGVVFLTASYGAVYDSTAGANLTVN